MHQTMIAATILALAAATTAATMVHDFMHYRLPNILLLCLLMLYGMWAYDWPQGQFLPWHALLWDTILAFAVLMLGFALYAIRALGAGDVKMLSIAFLWVGVHGAMSYFAAFALIGGAMSVLLLFGRPMVAALCEQSKLPRILQLRAPIPYGLAIGGGLLWYWWHMLPVKP